MSRKISVVVPAFNEESRIGCCIEALKNQSIENFECIIVDDGSTDSTLDAIYQAVGGDSRFKTLHTENKGLPAARNYALDRISDGLVFYADADDVPFETFLEEPARFLEENDLEMVFFEASLKNEGLDFISWNKERRYFYRNCSYEIYAGRKMFSLMMENNDFIAPVYLQAIRRNAIRHRFKEGILYEDELYTLQNMLSSKKVGHLKKALYERTCRKGSIVNSERGLLHSWSKWISARIMREFAKSIVPGLDKTEMDAVNLLSERCLRFAAKTWKSVQEGNAVFLESLDKSERIKYISEMEALSQAYYL